MKCPNGHEFEIALVRCHCGAHVLCAPIANLWESIAITSDAIVLAEYLSSYVPEHEREQIRSQLAELRGLNNEQSEKVKP